MQLLNWPHPLPVISLVFRCTQLHPDVDHYYRTIILEHFCFENQVLHQMIRNEVPIPRSYFLVAVHEVGDGRM